MNRTTAARTTIIATLLVCAGYYAGGAIDVVMRADPGALSGKAWPHLIQLAANLTQAAVAVALMRRVVRGPLRLDSLRRMGAFIAVAAFVVPLLFSAVVAWLFVTAGWVDDLWLTWQRRLFAQACGAIIVAAPMVSLVTDRLVTDRPAAVRSAPRQIVTFVALTAGLIVTLLATFAWEPARLHYQWLMFVPLPLLLLSAVRFGPAGLGLHLLVVAMTTLLAARAGRGPFVTGSPAQVVLALQGFLLAVSIPLMSLAALVRQHARATASLRQSQAQYRSVVEDQSELIGRFLPDGTFTFVNSAYCRYFERSADELVGQTLWQFIPAHEQAATRALLVLVTPDRPVTLIEHHMIAAGGAVRWHQWTVRGLFDEGGRIVEYQAVGRDITEQKRNEEAIRQSDKQLRLFVLHSPAAVAMFDRDMKYIICSQRWMSDYKLGYQEIVGRSHYDVFPEIPERWKEVHRRCLAGAVETHDDDSFVRGDGSTDWLRWEVRPWHDSRGEIGGVIMFTEVITERRRAEEEHRQLVAQRHVAEALQEVDRRKDEFLAMLAHELRNPLAPIVLATEIIRMSEPTDDSVNWARDVIARQAAQLTRLVDDLLDVSRITLGKIRLNRAALDMGPILAQAVEATQTMFSSRRHTLSLDVPDQPLPIRGDGARLTQIISNLLNNAAKFTGEGGRVTLRARQEGSHIVVNIADNGDGIPAHMLERVFDMFTQLHRPGDRGQDGLGIGLALVKRLVEMHDGDIEARSEGAGRGSEFIVRLPVATTDVAARDAPSPADAVVTNTTASQGVRRERVLVVDDNVDAAESLSRMLRLQEHEVLMAHDGVAALAAARQMRPDVVLLDIGLPELDGLEVARRLRQMSEAGPRPLLVAMTGFGQAEDRARTAAAGFDHHLTKPVDLQLLRSLIRTGGTLGI